MWAGLKSPIGEAGLKKLTAPYGQVWAAKESSKEKGGHKRTVMSRGVAIVWMMLGGMLRTVMSRVCVRILSVKIYNLNLLI